MQIRSRSRLEALLATSAPPRVPTVDEVMAYVVDVEARIQEDPTTAREALRRVLVNGITMHPQPDGTWLADESLIYGHLAGSKTRKPRGGSGPSGASGSQEVEIDGCAGRI